MALKDGPNLIEQGFDHAFPNSDKCAPMAFHIRALEADRGIAYHSKQTLPRV